MKLSSKCSLKILIDLQPCQAQSSSRRGVGRFSGSLFGGMLKVCKDHNIYGILNDSLRFDNSLSLDLTSFNLIKIPKLPNFYSYLAPDDIYQLAPLYSELVSFFYNRLNPDVVHISNFFEDIIIRDDKTLMVKSTLSHPSGSRAKAQVLSATLHDLIPFIFPESHLQHKSFKKFYTYRIQAIRSLDLLLANSETSRSDAINILGIPAEKVVTIYGGVSEDFKPAGDDLLRLKKELKSKYDIRKENLILYVTAYDARKNIEGAIEGFSKLSADLKAKSLLFIAGNMGDNLNRLISLGKSLGLSDDELYFSGFLPDKDLVNFYKIADLLLFPSFYEGLGLPILEGMRSAIPVIGSDSSSIRELIQRKDALFDPHDPVSIGKKIEMVLTDKNFARELSESGIQRSKEFTWENSAKKSIEAFEDVIDRKRKTIAKAAYENVLDKKTVAFLGSVSNVGSLESAYNATLIKFLGRQFNIDLYIENEQVKVDHMQGLCRIYDVEDFEKNAKKYDLIIYSLYAVKDHTYMIDFLSKFPSIVLLNDQFSFDNDKRISESDHNFSVKDIFDNSLGIISNSCSHLEQAKRLFPNGFKSDFRIIPKMVHPFFRTYNKQKSRIKSELGYDKESVLLLLFSDMKDSLLKPKLVELISYLKIHRAESFKILLADSNLKNRSSDLYKDEDIFLIEPDQNIKTYLMAADFSIIIDDGRSSNSRSNCILNSIAYAIPTIATESYHPEIYPDNILVKIQIDRSLDEIAKRLIDLIENSEMRTNLTEAAFDYIRRCHDPERSAASYAGAIYEMLDRKQKQSAEYLADQVVFYLSELNGGSINSLAKVTDFFTGLTDHDFKVSDFQTEEQDTLVQKMIFNREIYKEA